MKQESGNKVSVFITEEQGRTIECTEEQGFWRFAQEFWLTSREAQPLAYSVDSIVLPCSSVIKTLSCLIDRGEVTAGRLHSRNGTLLETIVGDDGDRHPSGGRFCSPPRNKTANSRPSIQARRNRSGQLLVRLVNCLLDHVPHRTQTKAFPKASHSTRATKRTPPRLPHANSRAITV
jgi:hypothetical protein